MTTARQRARSTPVGAGVTVWEPTQGDHLWVFPDSQDELGSGGEFHIYLDPTTMPDAAASFARFSLGAGGDLAEHRHEQTQEIGYLISGEGEIRHHQSGQMVHQPLLPGMVWHIAPGTWHAVANRGDEPLVMVFAVIPNREKGLLSFFRRIATKPGEPPNPISKNEIASIGLEHDFVLRSATRE